MQRALKKNKTTAAISTKSGKFSFLVAPQKAVVTKRNIRHVKNILASIAIFVYLKQMNT